MVSPSSDLTTLLARLAAEGVEFVLVGGLAAVAQGAPITTHDVDIVPKRTPANVDRLLLFLESIDAQYRGRANHDVLRPAAGALLGPGPSLLSTTSGPIDVLGTIEEGRAFEDLLPHAIAIMVRGNIVQVLGLLMLADLKRESTHAKDGLTLEILDETLRRRGDQ